MTYDDFVSLALELPETEEATSYGSPAVKRAGRQMFAMGKEGDVVSIKTDWPTRERVLEEHPDLCYLTPHHEPWPWFLVRLPKLSEELAREILQASWEDAPKPGKRKPS